MKKFFPVALVFALMISCLPVLPVQAGAEADPAKPPYINETYFPSEAFRLYVQEKFDKEEGKSLTVAEVESLQVIHVERLDITSLEGIQYFPYLEELFCAGNDLEGLDLRGNPELEVLHCADNAIIRTLDLSGNPQLRELNCSNNQIETLIISQCLDLEILNCAKNELTSLDISQHAELEVVDCSNNQISSFVFSNSANPRLGSMIWQPQKVELEIPEPSVSPESSEAPTQQPIKKIILKASNTKKALTVADGHYTIKVPVPMGGTIKIVNELRRKAILENVPANDVWKRINKNKPKQKGGKFAGWVYYSKDQTEVKSVSGQTLKTHWISVTKKNAYEVAKAGHVIHAQFR